MILGASWNVWDGEELLQASIEAIRGEIDYAIVVYQTKSHYGYDCSPYLLECLKDLKSDKLVDEIVEFNPGFVNKNSHQKRHMLEAQKRQLGYRIAGQLGCDYYISLDSDEIYLRKEFRRAKVEIMEQGYDGTAAYITTYHRNPAHKLVGLANFYVPFIHKISPLIKYENHTEFFVYADPTRGVTGLKNPKLLPSDMITMHHFTLTRNSLTRKFLSHNAVVNYISQYGDDFLQEKIKAAKDNSPRSKEFQPFENGFDYFNILEYIQEFNIKYGVEESDVGDLIKQLG